MGGGTAVDLEAWADTYGLNSPVASDTSGFASASVCSTSPPNS